MSNPRLIGVRFRRIGGFPNHLLFYRATEDTVDVMSVVHASRDWAKLLEDYDSP